MHCNFSCPSPSAPDSKTIPGPECQALHLSALTAAGKPRRNKFLHLTLSLVAGCSHRKQGSSRPPGDLCGVPRQGAPSAMSSACPWAQPTRSTALPICPLEFMLFKRRACWGQHCWPHPTPHYCVARVLFPFLFGHPCIQFFTHLLWNTWKLTTRS